MYVNGMGFASEYNWTSEFIVSTGVYMILSIAFMMIFQPLPPTPHPPRPPTHARTCTHGSIIDQYDWQLKCIILPARMKLSMVYIIMGDVKIGTKGVKMGTMLPLSTLKWMWIVKLLASVQSGPYLGGGQGGRSPPLDPWKLGIINTTLLYSQSSFFIVLH